LRIDYTSRGLNPVQLVRDLLSHTEQVDNGPTDVVKRLVGGLESVRGDLVQFPDTVLEPVAGILRGLISLGVTGEDDSFPCPSAQEVLPPRHLGVVSHNPVLVSEVFF
jgi:hypothetical protein